MNTRNTLLCLALGSASLVALPSLAEASNYPPDYDTCGINEYAYTGPFELILDQVQPDHAKLTVAYRGYLRDWFPDEDINIYISLNGNDAFIGASPGSYDDAYVFLNSGPRACAWCAPGDPPNNPSVCDEITLPEGSSGMWTCQDPSALEEHLFYWAFNQWGGRNDWDIQLAAEANGYWDSNWGANYGAYFDYYGFCS
ncbi:MAG: hypothetical protein KC431_20775 [Myxococcales bacterium]|nr:hypothetical protein [Myxococcales bacterium]